MTSKSVKKLRNLFQDRLVVFYLKEMSVASFDDEGNQLKISGMTDGYVIDIDEDFFYIGDENGGVEKVINHNVVAIVEVAKVEDSIFKTVDLPEEDEGIH